MIAAAAAAPERSLFGAPARFARGMREIAPGVCAWLQPNGTWSESNAGLVLGDGSAAVIDTLADLALSQRFVDTARGAAGTRPFDVLINTHGDSDHTGGNQLVGAPRRIATSAAAAQIAADSPAELERMRRLAGTLSLGRRVPISLGPADDAVVLGRYIVHDVLRPYDYRGIVVPPPTETFTGELAVDVGGRELRLVQVGPAHTAGDLLVEVPDAGVIFCGDILFVGITPIAWAGPIVNWVSALERLLRSDADQFVPGHGPLSGKDEVTLLLEYWRWLERSATGPLASGTPVPQLARELLRSDAFRQSPWGTWDSPERIIVNLVCLDHSRRGKPMPDGRSIRIKLFAQMATLAKDLRRG